MTKEEEEKGRGEETRRPEYDWKDILAIIIAFFETVMLPFIIFIAVLVIVFIYLGLTVG